jgi:hypothetical protein
MAGFEAYKTHEKGREHVVRFVGNAGATPTSYIGPGVTLAWVSTGIIDITWTNHPGTFLAHKSSTFQATTASQVKGFTVVCGDYNATTMTIRINITNAGETLADLSSTQKLCMVFEFKFGT